MKVTIGCRVDAKIAKLIHSFADKKKWTVSFALNEILKEYFERRVKC